MQTILDVVLPIFGLIALGAIVGRLGVLSADAGDVLARYVFVIAVPALLFRTLATAEFGEANILAVWAAYFIPVIVVWTLGTLFARFVLGADRRKSVIAGIASSFANTVLVALPVLQRAEGDAGLQPLLVILSIHLPVMMIASTLLIENAAYRDAGEAGGSAAAVSVPATLKRVGRNLATNAIVLGIVAGLTWRATGLPLIGVLDELARLLGSTAGPVALFALGMALTHYGVSGNVMAACVITVLSLVVQPGLVYLTGNLLGLTGLWLKGAVLTAAAPAGVNCYLLAQYFHSGERLAATMLLISTVLSVVTLSIWLAVLG